MSEIFDFTATTGIPERGCSYPALQDMAWQPCGADGFSIKPLMIDTRNGVETWLMKVDPGAYAGEHSHDDKWEQVYVLEGSFYDQNRTLHAGDFSCRSPGALHVSGSDEGAIVLLVYSPAT